MYNTKKRFDAKLQPITLTSELKEKLETYSEISSISKAAIIRNAIAKYLEEQEAA